MPRDAIKTIRDTEAKAHSIEAEAREKAREMIEETERSCIEFCEKEEAELQAELNGRLELLRRKSGQLIDRNVSANGELVGELIDAARLRMRGGVKIILQEIEKECQ